MLSGEARFRWLHARPGETGAVEQLAALAQKIYGDEAWVVTRDQMERRAGSAAPCSRRSGPGWATWP